MKSDAALLKTTKKRLNCIKSRQTKDILVPNIIWVFAINMGKVLK